MTAEDKVARLDDLVRRCELMAIAALEGALEPGQGIGDEARDRRFGQAHRIMEVANTFAVAYERASIALDEAAAEG